ncbi:hypothetical protein DOM22_03720 [Bdellovibrio sp. ZAP7]|uniref:c-type cytochrome domain-containing protein n=1 Tax=Bdellovibrio sp. ZAP7 TaxID=2231053 RepID=UPI001159730D|nr:hypothetical protein DOM22_03720 [Bdellovibrio sp. ZAP7]
MKLILCLYLCVVCLSACAPLEMLGAPTSNNSSSSNSSQSIDSPPANNALEILNQNCASCHGQNSGSAGVYGLQDINHMISAGLIVPGSPAQSLLYNEISSGSMPPSHPLTPAQQSTVEQWIVSISVHTAPVPTPTPTPSPTNPAPPVASYTSIQQDILNPKCVGCHSSSHGGGGVSIRQLCECDEGGKFKKSSRKQVVLYHS